MTGTSASGSRTRWRAWPATARLTSSRPCSARWPSSAAASCSTTSPCSPCGSARTRTEPASLVVELLDGLGPLALVVLAAGHQVRRVAVGDEAAGVQPDVRGVLPFVDLGDRPAWIGPAAD